MRKLRKNLKKYTPHKHCSYPADDWDYCWGWAGSIDKNKEIDFIENECINCEYYIKEVKNVDYKTDVN